MEQGFYPKRCTSSSLAETIASIEQVLTEILVRVPAKPLVRFKCVSKHWLSLISDPKFCHRHTLQNPNPPVSAVFCDKSNRIFCFIPIDFDHLRGACSTSINTSNHEIQNPSPSSSPPFNPLKFAQNQYHADIKIIQSCNGLFLCRLLYSPKQGPPYFIFNPTTNQFSTLIPPATGEGVQPCVISIALAFDPSKSPHYKVVCLRTIDGSIDGTIFHIAIYSSETHSWRILDSTFKRVSSILYSRVLYWNGAINWLGMYNDVAYFHVDEERDSYVRLPPHLYDRLNESRKYRYFMESSDGHHLHLIDIFRHSLTKFEVLEMGKDYSGWFVKYVVDLDPICRRLTPSERYVVLFIDQDKNEEEESSYLLLHTPGKLISYNLKCGTYKSFELTPKAGVKNHLLRVEPSNFRYMESLASV
ncbi:PREDICTED: F-box protein At5g07610-like [Fragaria vesca subsp. vesca]